MKPAITLLLLSLLTLVAASGCGGTAADNCDPECTGCCTDQGACIEPTWDGQCGTGGATCADCTELSSTCDEAGSCVCSGCFRDDGTCTSGKWNDECGSGGALCEECVEPEVCAEGRCTAPPECRPGECEGCCADNICLDGIANNACGKDGQECANCAANDSICNGLARQCEVPCSAATCIGCCVSEYECQEDGTGDAACGKDGATCANCTIEGQVCVDGACLEDSCSNTCDGCCDAARDCHDGDTLAECGLGGIDCRDCVDEIGVESSCSIGTCVSNSCAATCGGGCCQGDTCVEGDSPLACGSGGTGCAECGDNQDCISSECRLDPESLWNIVVESAEVPAHDGEGSSWDPFGGLPDVYIVVTAGLGTAYEVTDQTDEVNDQIFADYVSVVVLSNVPAKGIIDGLQFQWWDDDLPAGDDHMLTVNTTVDESLFTGLLLIVTSSQPEGDYIVRFRLVPAAS